MKSLFCLFSSYFPPSDTCNFFVSVCRKQMARKTPVKNKNKTENQPKEVPGKKAEGRPRWLAA